jgi:phage major head subunit gpT-like protein
LKDFELSLLRLRVQFNGAIIHDREEIGPQVIDAAVCISGRLPNLEKHFDQKVLNEADKQFPQGIGLRNILEIAARQNGHDIGMRATVRQLLEAAFDTRGHPSIRAEGFSTLSIPGTLSAIANKFLAQGFNAVEAGWRQIAAIRNVPDFKTATGYSLTGGMVYEKVGPTGEIKHADVGELSYTIKADTYGRMFAVTRNDLINDDLGALTQVPMKLGRGAALKLNDVFWTAFLANVATFWAAGNNNVISGGTSALSSSALNLAQTKFRKQTDPDGLPLGISAKYLLVPPELEIAATELMTSMIINTGGSSTTDRVPNRNIWNNKFEVVVSTYLSNTNYTGNSTTHWWLIADPMDLVTIEVAFLNGRDTPIVESADADFDVLGIQMRGYHDFGANKMEFRASVRSVGA